MNDSELSMKARSQVWCLGDRVYDNHRIHGTKDNHHDSYRVLRPTPLICDTYEKWRILMGSISFAHGDADVKVLLFGRVGACGCVCVKRCEPDCFFLALMRANKAYLVPEYFRAMDLLCRWGQVGG